MTKHLASSALALALLAAASTASADTGQSSVAGTVGVGAELQLNGLGGISANFDSGLFHVGGFFGFLDPTGPSNTAFDVGGRFFYHVHRTATADFSVGGSVGIGSTNLPAGGSTTDVFLEPSFQIRWFAASNVALSFTGGFSFGLDDDKTFRIGGQVTGIAGIHYYFTH